MRECIITRDDVRAMHSRGDPTAIVGKLKAAGFAIESEVCPVKLVMPYWVEGQPDGTLKFCQHEIAGAADVD